MFEQRFIKCIVFIFQFPIFSKEKRINILGSRLTLIKQAPIICRTTHYHIQHQYLITTYSKISTDKILFTLLQGKRSQWYPYTYSIMKSTPILQYFIDYPRCSGSTNNQQNILSCTTPSIPKILKSLKKTRLRCIHPRDFIYKYYLFLLSRGLNNIL